MNFIILLFLYFYFLHVLIAAIIIRIVTVMPFSVIMNMCIIKFFFVISHCFLSSTMLLVNKDLHYL